MTHQPYPPRPPRPDNRRATIIIVIVAIAVLLVGGTGAVLAGREDRASQGSSQDDRTAGKQSERQRDRSAPREVTPGAAFTIGKHETLAGWKVLNESGMFSIEGKAKNVSKDTSTAFFHVKFLSADGTVVGNVMCNTGDLEAGQSEALNCIPDGRYGKWVKVTAEATF